VSSPTTLITGGAGYIGLLTADELLDAGRRVRVLDVLLHDQADRAAELEERGVEVIRGDIRDTDARRLAVDGADEVVHLAAIVGDPACARDPETAHAVNVEAARAVIQDAAAAGVQRFIFASTCSNYGRMADPTVPITEEGELAPVSLYAEQKVAVETELLGRPQDEMATTCLRFATVYGVAPRMRFDLTVNEFTRDLWADRALEVFGEQFWRPYVHVRDAARGIRAALEAPADEVAGQVFNVGRSGENYTKQHIVDLIQERTDRGSVSFVKKTEDPRDYKVSFDKVRSVLGFETRHTVPDGIDEILQALDGGAFADPFDGRYRNIA
jgi:nucleoside-diphosphate-sugar epimerase